MSGDAPIERVREAAPIKVDASDLHDVIIHETPDGEGFRRIRVTWKTAGGTPQEFTLHGHDAHLFHVDAASMRAHGSEDRFAAYVLGRIRSYRA